MTMRDRRLLARMVATTLAVTAVNGVFVVVVASLLWPWLSAAATALGGVARPAGVVALVVAVVGVGWLQVGYVSRQSLAAVDADPATADSHPRLHGTVARLASVAGVPTPSVAVAPTDVPNSFAVGGPRSATLVVSQGLLDRVDDDELAAVVGHELAHVSHRDAAVLTLAAFLPALAADEFTPLADRASPALVGAGLVAVHAAGVLLLDVPGTGSQSLVAVAVLVGGGLLLGSAALGVLAAPVVGLSRRLARDREFAADHGGALLSGSPAALASALESLSGVDCERIDARLAARALCLLPHGFGGADDPTATRAHPPVDERVRRLRDLASEVAGGDAY